MAEATESVQPDQGSALGCPLCHDKHCRLILHTSMRDYYRCQQCDLSFVPRHFHLSTSDEKAIYDLHENNPNDDGYRNFLSRLSKPLVKLLRQGDKGLDFGSGPGPTLAIILGEQGYPTENFDIYYANHPELLEKKYDFITSTEVVEHLSQPDKVFATLFSCLKPNGKLGIMTKRTPDSNFETWHYIKDPTHISFFSEITLAYIAKQYQCKLALHGSDTAIFIKE